MHRHDFIFSEKPAIRILRHVCFWIFWFIYQVILFLYNNSNVVDDFWLNLEVRCLKLLRVFPFIIIQCYIVMYWLVPKFLYTSKYVFFLSGLLISAIGTIFFVDIATYNSFDFLPLWIGVISYLSRSGPMLFLVFFTIKTLKTWYLKELEKDALLKENLNAELQLLKAQVHPHFLFNTLNNIYAFILSNPEKAQHLIRKLEKLLRYMINECEQQFVPLTKEISSIQDYLELEKVRYGNRLETEIDMTVNYKNKYITPLLMIPFIENSFKHGTSRMLKNPWIKLFIQADEEVLHFSLTNSKPENEMASNKKGIGLNNVKKRLDLLYPRNHLLEIESTPNTFTVNMQVPLQKIEEEIVA